MGNLTDIPNENRQVFLAEAEDHLRIWEQTLLSLEREPANAELLSELFRSIHTLKGCAGFVGCEEMQRLAHELESDLQVVRENNLPLEPGLIEVLFAGLDMIKRMVSALAEDTVFDGNIEGLVSRARAMRESMSRPGQKERLAGEMPAEEMPPDEQAVVETPQAGQGGPICQIDVQIVAEQREAYLRALLIQSKLKEAGRIIGISPPLEDLRLGTGEFRFRVTVETDKPVEELRKDIDIDQVNILAAWMLPTSEAAKLAAGEAIAVEEERAQIARPGKIDEIVRVPVEKLDTMMNLVGELVIQNSGFISSIKSSKAAYGKLPVLLDFEQKTESLARIARSLQDAVMKVRMLPVATLFSRFNRVVRDLAKHRGREVELEISGEETEIDKKVMDRIGEPLIHLLRNAVDHGIEPVDERSAYGKDGVGHIRLGAYQEGDRICVEVKDDGRGLSREAIAARAVEMGLASAEAVQEMSDEDIYRFIFLPGFSTAKEITDISGRGIGCDIVKRTVEEMGGSVRLHSAFGLGTSITITLPLTMAIINALLVETGRGIFAIPLSSVREAIQVRESQLQHFGQNKVYRLREEVIAVLEMDRVLGLVQGQAAESSVEDPNVSIVVVDYGNRKVGLVVDALRGREEIVIKSLTGSLEGVAGLVGVSILGTGKLALILDTRAVLDSFYRENEADFLFNQQLADAQKREEPQPEVGPAAAQSVRAEAAGQERIVAGQASASPPAALPFPWGKAEISRFEECLIGGAVSASQSLSELLNRDIRVSFPEIKLVPIGDVATSLGGEELPVGGIFIALEGDIRGGTLLVLPVEYVNQFSDLLFNRPAGSTKQVTDEEMSALRETGNILSSSFVGAIGDMAGLAIRLRVPEMSLDMCLAVIDSVLARFDHPGTHTLLIEADLFYAEQEQVVCHLLILLERDSFERLMAAITERQE
jgi:two-component system chemotaxis sensor kinase CheA